jgi:hypothetical protein
MQVNLCFIYIIISDPHFHLEQRKGALIRMTETSRALYSHLSLPISGHMFDDYFN